LNTDGADTGNRRGRGEDPRDVVAEGGCHCGRVRFRVTVPTDVTVTRCNCSICRMTGYEHLFVPREAFHLLRGAGELRSYRFNTGQAEHLFCAHCGIKSFYVPRSHPDAYSVHLGCVALPEEVAVSYQDFDGADWERNIDQLRGG
jgi:hypothetical protein